MSSDDEVEIDARENAVKALEEAIGRNRAAEGKEPLTQEAMKKEVGSYVKEAEEKWKTQENSGYGERELSDYINQEAERLNNASDKYDQIGRVAKGADQFKELQQGSQQAQSQGQDYQETKPKREEDSHSSGIVMDSDKPHNEEDDWRITYKSSEDYERYGKRASRREESLNPVPGNGQMSWNPNSNDLNEKSSNSADKIDGRVEFDPKTGKTRFMSSMTGVGPWEDST